MVLRGKGTRVPSHRSLLSKDSGPDRPAEPGARVDEAIANAHWENQRLLRRKVNAQRLGHPEATHPDTAPRTSGSWALVGGLQNVKSRRGHVGKDSESVRSQSGY